MSEEKKLNEFELGDKEMDSVSGGIETGAWHYEQPRFVGGIDSADPKCLHCSSSLESGGSSSLVPDSTDFKCNNCGKRYNHLWDGDRWIEWP